MSLPSQGIASRNVTADELEVYIAQLALDVPADSTGSHVNLSGHRPFDTLQVRIDQAQKTLDTIRLQRRAALRALRASKAGSLASKNPGS